MLQFSGNDYPFGLNLKLFLSIYLLSSLFPSCQMPSQEMNIEELKQEVLKTEKAFAEMLNNEGLSKAFLAYAADDAVLMRNNKLIIGKDSIRDHLNGQNSKSLSWTPDYVDVSKSGDMAYTYGKYSFKFLDENGLEQESRGVFHTVWKRQEDGSWKFVWD